jgi:peptidoglycan/LPS O-acetylase OafA/YrhL
MRRLPSLDGLRAVSITMVVACHAAKVLSADHHVPGLGLFRAFGPLGVTVFFVISGFLITTLLLEELRRSGEIRLSAFYGRRAFRILPAYWAFLAGVFVLTCSGLVENPPTAFGRALFFVSDYASTHTWSLGHSWSLSVEEQFYLLWPAALVALGPRRARTLALALVVGSPLIRLGSYLWTPELRGAIGNMLHTRVDALMIGCLLALLRQERHAVLGWATRRWAGAAAAGVLLLLAPAATVELGGIYQLVAGYSLEAIAAGVLVQWAIENSGTLAGRALNVRWIAAIGSLSYSLYLWQEPLLDPHAHLSAAWLPVRIALAFGLAWGSYRFIEQPFLALRARLRVGEQERPSAAIAT